MTIEEKIEIMQAFARGSKIQFRRVNIYDESWTDVAYPSWNWSDSEYRIKPEPEMRPYKNREEFLKEMKLHGPFLETVDNSMLCAVSSINDTSITTKWGTFTFEHLSTFYKWQDGAICKVRR